MTPNAEPDRPWGRDAPSSLTNRIRARDVRIPYVERAFLARQLGLGRDDLELLPDAAVEALLNTPTSVMNVIGAERLLEQLDAAVAREHPVDLDFPHDNVTVANVPMGDDEVLRVTSVIVPDAHRIVLDCEATPAFSPDDAEALAYALLRLVEHQRATEPPTEEVP